MAQGLPLASPDVPVERLPAVVAALREVACAAADPDVLFDLAARIVRGLLAADTVIVGVPQGDQCVLRAGVGVPEGLDTSIPLAGTTAGEALSTRRPVLVSDAYSGDEPTLPELNRRFGLRSSVVVPLLDNGRAFACLSAISHRSGAFDESDLAVLALVTDVLSSRMAHAVALSERSLASSALRTTTQRLRAAQELSGLGLWSWRMSTRELTVDAKMHALLGLSPEEEVTVERVFDRLHPADALAARQLAGSCLQGTPGQGVVRVPQPDGSARWLAFWSDVSLAPDGTPDGVWGVMQNVTEREEAAAALRTSEEHFRLSFDGAPVGMLLVGLRGERHGAILRANPAWCAMLGLSEEESRALAPGELMPPAHRESTLDALHRMEQGELTRGTAEMRMRHRDGHEVDVRLEAAVAPDAQGRPLYAVCFVQDLTEQRRTQAELERLALYDTLTGLANRALLMRRLEETLADHARSGGCLALLMLDLDRFKLINDSLGHHLGDQLLVEAGGRLAGTCRSDATVARLGGDEFVVLLPDVDGPGGAAALARRVLEVLRAPYDTRDGVTLVTSASIGVSTCEDGQRSAAELFREADLALYRAKENGRDRFALFDAELRQEVDERLGAEQTLRRALDERRLVLLYQPVVSLVDGSVRAVEALVRIDEPGRGLLPPAAFIEVAEESGLIAELDGQVLEAAAEQVAAWRAAGCTTRVGVNVSPRSLQLPHYGRRFEQALLRHPAAKGELLVELTERSLLGGSAVVEQSLRRLRELGAHMAVDDFGTGYSALAYLGRFELDALKIDRSFVSRLGTRQGDAVVAAVIDLAHAHDLVVVAEGVETYGQAALLRAMGCDRAQGYLFGRPMPAAGVPAVRSVTLEPPDLEPTALPVIGAAPLPTRRAG
nr:EAL domain-containing protein [Motilibacter aurantiacus]